MYTSSYADNIGRKISHFILYASRTYSATSIADHISLSHNLHSLVDIHSLKYSFISLIWVVLLDSL